MLLEGVAPQHLAERVVQRPQIGVDLALQIAGQKSELLARLHRGTGEYDARNLLLLERGHGHRHRKEGFAGARRADAEHDCVFLDFIDVILLADGFRLDRLSAAGQTDAVVVNGRQLVLLALGNHRHHIVDRVDVDVAVDRRNPL